MSNRVVAPNFTGFSALTLSAILTAVFPFNGTTGATVARLSFEVSAVRVSVVQGFTATSGSGHLFTAGQTLELIGADVIKNLNLCATVPTGFVMASVGYL